MNPKEGNVSFVLFQGSWLNPRLAIARQSIDSPYMMYCINPYNDWTYYLNTMLKVSPSLPPSLPPALLPSPYTMYCINPYMTGPIISTRCSR